MAKEEIVRRAVEGVKRAKGYCDDVEFSPEDAARTELDFLAEVVERAIEAGATTVNIPDTVGYAVPEPVRRRHPPSEEARPRHRQGRASASTATTTSAWPWPTAWPPCKEGARQVECTINGIGERAGNCALEEIVMAVRTRGDYFGIAHRHQHAAALPDQPAGVARHRHPGAAQQGHRRPERLRPRGRHPPGRHAQGAHAPTRS